MTEFSPDPRKEMSRIQYGNLEKAWQRMNRLEYWEDYSREDVEKVINQIRSDSLPEPIPPASHGRVFDDLKSYLYRYTLSAGNFLCVPYEYPTCIGHGFAINPSGRLEALRTCIVGMIGIWHSCQHRRQDLPTSAGLQQLSRSHGVQVELGTSTLQKFSDLGKLLDLSQEECLRELLITLAVPIIESQNDRKSVLERLSEDIDCNLVTLDGKLTRVNEIPLKDLFCDSQVETGGVKESRSPFTIYFTKAELKIVGDTASAYELTIEEFVSQVVDQYFTDCTE